MIERRIIIGFITSTEFIQRMHGKWNVHLFESPTAKRIATWCLEFYTKYNTAPGREIEPIFYSKIKNANFPKDLAEEISEDILPSLSKEYERASELNLDYLVEEALAHFSDRLLLRHSDQIRGLVETDKRNEALKIATGFVPLSVEAGNWVDLSSPSIQEKVEKAFNEATHPLIVYPGALGEFWNKYLVRDAFVAFMGAEKRGKTFRILEMLMRASKQKRKVAFFQAGDMTESDQIKRIGVYMAQKSNLEEYAGRMYEPAVDCVLNQLNQCRKKERTCDFGVFVGRTEKFLRKELPLIELKQAWKENKEYKPCHNCKEFARSPYGVPWYTQVDVGDALTAAEAIKCYEEFFVKEKRNFKISTHTNGTLTVHEIKAILDIWKQQDNYVPDVIGIDYADILEDDREKETRHKQNRIWKDLRGLSQERHALVITATQADGESYAKDLLTLANYSEDKRKYGHVTAMWGLNQDTTGREKELKIMRLNQMVMRDGDFSVKNQVHVLQNLQRGRPYIASYW